MVLRLIGFQTQVSICIFNLIWLQERAQKKLLQEEEILNSGDVPLLQSPFSAIGRVILAICSHYIIYTVSSHI